MKAIELQPVREEDSDYDAIEEEILRAWKTELYKPLLVILGQKGRVLNEQPTYDLKNVQYVRGLFTGKFTGKLSKELKAAGAVWDRKKRGWRLPLRKMPMELRSAISTSQAAFNRVVSSLDERLAKMLPEEIANRVRLQEIFDTTLWKTDRKLSKTLRAITVQPKLSKEAAQKIAKEYTNNLRLSIQEWTRKEIVSLRKQVQENAYKGLRYEGMVKTIQKSYGVGIDKAKFLARQETSLLMSKFKHARYKDAGIQEYKWRSVIGSPKHPVRPMHKLLNNQSLKGKVFRFDDPPVDDPTGSRHNPGENYNCRCVAVPIVKF